MLQSQTDYANGFGGKFGVASERQDKSAVGFDHVEKLSKHSSQTGKSLLWNFGKRISAKDNFKLKTTPKALVANLE